MKKTDLTTIAGVIGAIGYYLIAAIAVLPGVIALALFHLFSKDSD